EQKHEFEQRPNDSQDHAPSHRLRSGRSKIFLQARNGRAAPELGNVANVGRSCFEQQPFGATARGAAEGTTARRCPALPRLPVSRLDVATVREAASSRSGAAPSPC